MSTTGKPADRELLTSSELAQTLRVSVGTIERWRFEGVGPKPIRLGPRTVRYSRSEVEQYVDTHSGH